jgi:hypothetical protein
MVQFETGLSLTYVYYTIISQEIRRLFTGHIYRSGNRGGGAGCHNTTLLVRHYTLLEMVKNAAG